MLEDLGVLSTTPWVQELMDPKKATYPLMSESGSEQSWYGQSNDLKEALLGFMSVNDITESSYRQCDFPTACIWSNWNGQRC